MAKRRYVRNTAIVLLSLIVLSCQKEEVDLSNINLLSVRFLKANNPSLESSAFLFEKLTVSKVRIF